MKWLVLAALAACASEPDRECVVPDGAHSDPTGTLCKQLSEYGFFDDIATQRPIAGVIPYDVNTPLFSDYAVKDRYVYLPPGTAMTWNDSDAFALPPGAAVIKTFGFLVDRRDPSLGKQLVETRVLLRTDTGWTGASYIYDAGGTDAHLAVAGGTVDLAWTHDDGSPRTDDYAVPNKNQCKNCHAEHDKQLDLLGPKARHLNRRGPAGSGIDDQLQYLVDHQLLVGAPAAAQWPRDPDAFDPATGTLDERARTWIDVNCSNCHNPRGPARTSGLFLEYTQTDPTMLGVCKPPVAAGKGTGGRSFAIVPGKPDESILLYRIESTEPEIKMPELGRNLVFDEGAALIRAWIAAMPGSCPD